MSITYKLNYDSKGIDLELLENTIPYTKYLLHIDIYNKKIYLDKELLEVLE